MTNSAPLIGIPCRRDTSSHYSQSPVNAQNDTYLAAICQAGGIPFLIPLNLADAALRRLYDLADGILLTGGGDIEPVRYQQSPHTHLYDVQPDRDELEFTLSRWAMQEQKPLLAICRGIQVMTVAAGGELYQDLPTQMPEATLHDYKYNAQGSPLPDYLAHSVELKSNCRLRQIIQTDTIHVNSLHHQAVKNISAPLQVVGCSGDGVTEVIEHPDHPFFIGVQWHPELLVGKQLSARQIFTAFVEASQAAA